MDVVLLHDAREPPFDLFPRLRDAGHRVASHGTEPDALPAFLAAMRWRPEAVVVDFRGRAAKALDALRCVAKEVPEARVLLVHVPAGSLAEAREAAAAGVVVGGVDGVLRELAAG